MLKSIEAVEVELVCKKCGRKTKKSVGWINNKKDFICVCGVRNLLDASQLKAKLAKIERRIASIGKIK